MQRKLLENGVQGARFKVQGVLDETAHRHNLRGAVIGVTLIPMGKGTGDGSKRAKGECTGAIALKQQAPDDTLLAFGNALESLQAQR